MLVLVASGNGSIDLIKAPFGGFFYCARPLIKVRVCCPPNAGSSPLTSMS